MLSSRPVPSASRRCRFILLGGVVAGTLDIVYAWVFWRLKAGVPMQRILQSVAAGLLGRSSYAGGFETAAFGLGLHFAIATAMAIAYFVAVRIWPPIGRYPVLSGAGYGLFLYGFMNYVVVPLSAAGAQSRDPLWIALSVIVHVAFVGIPIAVATTFAARQT